MTKTEKFEWFKAGFMIGVGAPFYHKELKDIGHCTNAKEIMKILCRENVQKIIQLSFELATNEFEVITNE